jgi:DNA-directed RNA polymerase subunit RPC12/RpoP
MKHQIQCPKCKEILDVIDNKKYIDCPYCGEEFKIPEKNVLEKNTANKKSIDEWNKLFKK